MALGLTRTRQNFSVILNRLPRGKTRNDTQDLEQ